MARNPTIGMFVGDAEIKRRKNVRRDLQAIGTLTEQTCRDKAQEVVIATERVLGEKFNVAARHELVNQIVATFATSVSAPVGSGEQSESGWLLEKMYNGQVHYISADYVLQWTDDPNKALRLARRKDAEALCTIVDDCEKIASHEWVPAVTSEGDK